MKKVKADIDKQKQQTEVIYRKKLDLLLKHLKEKDPAQYKQIKKMIDDYKKKFWKESSAAFKIIEKKINGINDRGVLLMKSIKQTSHDLDQTIEQLGIAYKQHMNDAVGTKIQDIKTEFEKERDYLAGKTKELNTLFVGMKYYVEKRIRHEPEVVKKDVISICNHLAKSFAEVKKRISIQQRMMKLIERMRK